MQDAVAEAEVDSVPPEDVPTVLPEAALVGAASGLPPPRWGPRYHPPRYYGPPVRHVGGRPPALVLIILVFFIALVFAVPALYLASGGGSGGSITPSTVERTPLDRKYVTTTDWYTDELGWIHSGSTLEAGMKEFFDKTGVQPYLYLTDTVNGTTIPSEEDMDSYANQLYDELFDDEGHILLLFYEHNSDGNYREWYVCGAMAKTVLDQEACDILLDYVDHYYYSDLTEDEMFSRAFSEAAGRIMAVTRSPLPIILVAAAALAIVIIAFIWWRKAKKQKNLEAEQKARILNTPIEELGSEDPSLKDREERYQTEEGKNT